MKNRTIFLAVWLLQSFCIASLHAQQPFFAKVYYDLGGEAQAFAIVRTWDGNYMIGGEYNYSAMVMKTDPGGNIILSKRIDQSGFSCFYDMTATHDSGFVLAGTQGSFAYYGNVYVVKINNAGDTLWTRFIPMNNNAFICSINMTADHGFILAGCQRYGTGGTRDMLVIRLDAGGHISWCKTYHSYPLTGNQQDNAYNAREMPNGDILVTGQKVTATPAAEKGCLLCLTADGTVSWAKTVGTSFSAIWDAAVSSNGITSLVASSSLPMYLMRTDLSGNILWANATDIYSGTQFWLSPMPKLHMMNDGGYAFASSVMGPAPMTRTDSLGACLFAKNLWLNPAGIAEGNDGSLMILGNGPIQGVNMGPTDNPQIGLIKSDSAGATPDCMTDSQCTTTPVTVNLAAANYAATPLSTVASPFPEPQMAATLSVFDGCVEIVGKAGEKGQEREELVVTPNPSDGRFTFSLSCMAKGTYEVFNVNGTMVTRGSFPASAEYTVDLTSLPSGLYSFRAHTPDGAWTRKIVIQH